MRENFRKQILIIDDHPLMRKGLAITLETDPGFEVVDQLERGEEVLQKLNEYDLDLMIVDISLPGMSGLELIKHVLTRNPGLKILVVSRHDESVYAERVIRAGARGYVMKMEAGDVLLKAVRKVLNGGIYLSPEVSEKLLMGMAQGPRDLSVSPIEQLSDRELEVFELTGKGNSTREIAGKLHLSVKTVESYRARIKTKLNLDNATELMVHAVSWVKNEKPESL